MDYSQLIKKLDLPGDFSPPTELTFENLVAKPLTRNDLAADLEGVNSSVEIIQKTRGGTWPQGKLSEDFDLLDLAWHEREFRDRNSFAYVVYKTDKTYLGCFYLYPLGGRTSLSENLMNYDVDASWWVTASAYDAGYYTKLYEAMNQWLKDSFPFQKIYYSNLEIPESV